MLESVNEKYTFAEAVERARQSAPLLAHCIVAHVHYRTDIKLDPDFKSFFEWAKKANVPVVIVSSGMS